MSLRSGIAIVDPRPLFAELTGDGKSDAVVPLSGGAAGTVAVYVLSTDGSSEGKLRVIFRSQRLYRATIAVGKGPSLVVGLSSYAIGDAVCCPAKRIRQAYAWARATRTLRRTSSRVVDGSRTPPPLPPSTELPPATTTPSTTTAPPTTTPGGGATAP